MLRVTNSMIYRQTALDLQRANLGYAQASEEVSSGKRINQPSDDPAGSVISQYSHLALADVTQYTSNVGAVKSWLSQDSSSLQNMVDQLSTAQQYATQASTGTYNGSDRATMASSVQNIIAELLSMGNAQVNGSYIYAGTDNNTPALASQMQVQAQASQTGLNSDYLYYKTTASVANPATTAISSDIGETFGFTGQGSQQTYETSQALTFTGGALTPGDSDSITIGANTYTVNQGGGITTAALAAQNLAEQINSDASANSSYLAVVDTSGPNPVLKVYADQSAAYPLSATGNNLVGSPVTAATTMNNLVSAINNGQAAQGVLMLSGNSAGSVTINGTTLNWLAAGSTAATLTNIAGAINSDPTLGPLVSARVDGNEVIITAANNGSQYDYAISGTGANTIVPVGALHGGLAGTGTTGVQASTVVNSDGTHAMVLQSATAGQTISLGSDQTLGLSQGLSFSDLSQIGDGRLYGQGTYTGLYSRNITLTVDPSYAGGVPSAANPMQVNYSYVDDFGRTISGAATVNGTGSGNALDLGNGVQFYAGAQNFAAGEQFNLAVGRQLGNDQQMSATLSQANRMAYNHTIDQLLGQEGDVSGSRNNLLDQLTGWNDALQKDSTTQTYFEAIPGVSNSPSSSADLRVSGDWGTLGQRSYQFVVGGPVQTNASAASRADYRNFTVDPAYAGGVPSAGNPMVVHYEWFDNSGPGWTAATANITGTGAANPVTLNSLGAVPANPPAATINLVNAAYTAGQSLPMAGSATPGDPPYIANSTTPSAGQPVTVTYTYLDNNQVRQWGTTSFSGSGDGAANVLSMNPPNDSTVRLSSGGTLKDGDSWNLTLAQYNQGQTVSSQMLTALASARVNLLECSGDAGAKLDRLEVRSNLLSSDNVQIADRLSSVESADISQVTTNLQQFQLVYQASLQALALVSSGYNLAYYL